MSTSPHSTIPVVSITRADPGWLVTCACGHETYHPRRPGADRARHEHMQAHAKKKGGA